MSEEIKMDASSQEMRAEGHSEEFINNYHEMMANVQPPKPLNIVYTEYTNTKGDLNKSFSVDSSGDVVKQSNAFMSEGTAKVMRLPDLSSFDQFINNLKPNQAIGLGVPINDLTNVNICKKGEEDISMNVISRTKDYQQWPKKRALCLFDYDPDEAMGNGLRVNSADELREVLIKIVPLLSNVEMIIRSGSSYGVKNKEGVCVSCKQSYHVYFEILLDENNTINDLIEYFLSSSVQQNLYYLKIFSDGRSELRTAIDLSVLKSAESRLIFESSPTCKDGLYQERSETKFYNKGTSIPLDIKELNSKNLPNWQDAQEQLKELYKHKIQQVKKEYQSKQIEKFMANGLTKKEALEKFKLTYENLLMPSEEIIILNDGTQQSLLDLIKNNTESLYTCDVYEPLKGSSKSIVSPRNIFDSTLYTYLRGGLKYSVYFTVEQIKEILEDIIDENIKRDLEKVLKALILYCVQHDMTDYSVKQINDLLVNRADIEDFELRFKSQKIKTKSMKLLENHAVLAFGGKVGIIDTKEIILNDFSEQGMKTLYKNKLIYGKNPVDVWLGHKDRKEFHKVVFAPDGDVQPLEYNVFKGFKYQPKQNDEILRPFFDLVRNVICNGDDSMYGLVWAWMANIIQDPASKLGTALVLRGKKGAGKGTFATVFGKLLGEYFLETAEKKRIFGDFNAHLSNTLCVYLNEAFWSGDKTSEGKLKNLITDIHFTYEIKQGAVFSGKNYTHLIIDSNEDYVVPDGPDERRYINLDVSSCRLGNNEFFDSLYSLSNKKEFLEALMFALSTFDYSAYLPHLRKAPKTAMSKDQLLYSLQPIEEWWLHCLYEGEISNASYEIRQGSSLLIGNEQLFESFRIYIKNKGKKVYESSVTFGQKFVGKIVSDDIFIHKNTKTTLKKSGKHIKSLSDCRTDFCTKYRLDAIESAVEEWEDHKSIPQIIQN